MASKSAAPHSVETTSHDDDHSSSHTLVHSQKRDIPSREVGHQLGSAPRQAQRHTTHDTPVTASCQHQPSSARTSIGGSADAMVAPSSNFSLDSSDIIAMPRAVATRQVLEAARRHCTTLHDVSHSESTCRTYETFVTPISSIGCAVLCTKLACRRARAGNRHGALAARRCGCIACGCCISILNQQGRTPGTQSRVVCPPDDCASPWLLLWHPHHSPER